MFGIENYAGFLAAGVLLNMLPGVDSVYVLTRSAAEGKRVGVASVFGISTGVLFHTTLVALGLSAVLAASPKAFFAVKLAGAAYLLWLGIKTFREKGSFIPTESAEPKKTGLWGAYLQGFLTNALNPKVNGLSFFDRVTGFHRSAFRSSARPRSEIKAADRVSCLARLRIRKNATASPFGSTRLIA